MNRVLLVCVAVASCGGGTTGRAAPVTLADGAASGTEADCVTAVLEERLLAPYVARHPGLEVVRRVASSRAEYRRTLRTSLASGEPPDVFLLEDGDVPALLDRRAALDLAPYVGRAGVDVARYDPAVLAMFRRGDALHALPKGYTPLVLAYNKTLFDRAGIPYPTDDWTWDEFLRVARALTRDTRGDGAIDQWGSAFDWRPSVWLAWIWAGGGDVLCADGRRASGCLDSPATVAALRWYRDWLTVARIAPPIADPRDAPGGTARLFARGRIALLVTGHWAVPELRAAVARGPLRVGFVAIPHRAGVPAATVLYASGYAVPATLERRKPAVELAADLSDSTSEAARAEAGLELPAVLAAAQALAAADTLGWDAVFLRAAAHGRAPWEARIAQWPEVEARLAGLLTRIVVTDADPARAAGDAARELDGLLGATK
jgi:multiple sugar transport system substrate-binding protein